MSLERCSNFRCVCDFIFANIKFSNELAMKNSLPNEMMKLNLSIRSALWISTKNIAERTQKTLDNIQSFAS